MVILGWNDTFQVDIEEKQEPDDATQSQKHLDYSIRRVQSKVGTRIMLQCEWLNCDPES